MAIDDKLSVTDSANDQRDKKKRHEKQKPAYQEVKEILEMLRKNGWLPKPHKQFVRLPSDWKINYGAYKSSLNVSIGYDEFIKEIFL
ncbi:MAG TPA: hypothetical protein VJI75_02535 [Candidatus Nanoarchaeia archaeon]|nr:hypothetical protein [Candidatus Nanoarchaeia archaeon]